MAKTKDLTGQIFGRWKALYQIENAVNSRGWRKNMWMRECQCEKHTRKAVDAYHLINRYSQSCGCLRKESSKNNGLKLRGKDNLKNRRENTYDLSNEDYVIGYTQSGKEFYFDKEDFDLVSRYCWDIDNSTGYAKTIDRANKTGKLYLHRLVMGCTKGDGIIIDHIDRNRIDCRKKNLRFVNDIQSAINKGIKSNNTSGKVGVSWSEDRNKWESYITVNKKRLHLGMFDDFEEAEKVRMEAEEKYFGEYNPIY